MQSLFRTISVLVLFAAPVLSQAQSVSLGADLVNRYVWRGFDFGESFSVQPTLEFSTGGFAIGSWASYSVSADGAGANEHDLYASYGVSLGESLGLSLGVTDYYFPSPDGADWSSWDGDGEGAHWIELMVGIESSGSFPLSLSAAYMVHNDPDGSLYVEAGLPFEVGDVGMGLALGMAANQSGFYAVESASLINMTLSASKDIVITESFSLPVSAAYILNPTHDRSFLVFGISL